MAFARNKACAQARSVIILTHENLHQPAEAVKKLPFGLFGQAVVVKEYLPNATELGSAESRPMVSAR